MKNLCFTILFLGIFTPFYANAAWYEEHEYSKHDPFGLEVFLFHNKWFTQPVILDYENAHKGLVFATLNAEDKEKYLNYAYIVKEKILSADETKSLKSTLQLISGDKKVPLFMQVGISTVSNFLLTPTWSSIQGGIFAFILETGKNNITNISHDSLSLIVATGGEIKHISTLRESGNRSIFINLITYSVSVGDETRTVLLYTSSYPTNIKIRSFKTTVGTNDKIVQENENGKWYIYNAITKEKDNITLIKVGEDEDFYLFSEQNQDSTDGNLKFHRINRHGGTWDTSESSLTGDGSTSWSPFYSSTIAIEPIDFKFRIAPVGISITN